MQKKPHVFSRIFCNLKSKYERSEGSWEVMEHDGKATHLLIFCLQQIQLKPQAATALKTAIATPAISAPFRQNRRHYNQPNFLATHHLPRNLPVIMSRAFTASSKKNVYVHDAHSYFRFFCVIISIVLPITISVRCPNV
jgi:hypothetical protein